MSTDVAINVDLNLQNMSKAFGQIPQIMKASGDKGAAAMKKAGDSVAANFTGKIKSAVGETSAMVSGKLTGGFKTLGATGAAAGKSITAAFAPLLPILAPLAAIGGVGFAMKARMNEAKSYRESLRDLEGQMGRLNEIDQRLGYTSEANRQKMRDLQIQVEQLNFANRNLTDADKEREAKMAELGGRVQALGATILDSVMKVMDTLEPAMSWVVGMMEGALPTAIAVVETVFKEWKTGVALAVVGVELTLVRWYEKTKHMFTEQLPYAFTWFVENASTIFTDFGHNVISVFSNIGKNIWDFIKAIKAAMRGEGWKFKATAIFADTVNNTTPFEPPERQKSEREQNLEKENEMLMRKIGDTFTKSYAEASGNLERNQRHQQELLAGVTAPISAKEMEKIMENSQKSSTSDLVGAWQNIQNNFSNRNPTIVAADMEVAAIKAADQAQANRDAQQLAELRGIKQAMQKGGGAAAYS